MTGLVVGAPAATVVCGTVLLLTGDPFGRDLISLGLGMYLVEEEK